ncbi:MAG: GIY-YIG nuclease family protein [Methanobacteriaceae archaeon]|nr:GIY-YIG nuclease family protein [Methanobacteriaceae archaeon]
MCDVDVDKGVYCLLIRVSKDVSIVVGALGSIDFKKGYYVYVGSALGVLSKRIDRHLSLDKKKHWHVDYLLLDDNVDVCNVVYTQCTSKIECQVSVLIDKTANGSISGFGCSDCGCVSHLYYFEDYDDAFVSCCGSFRLLGYGVLERC